MSESDIDIAGQAKVVVKPPSKELSEITIETNESQWSSLADLIESEKSDEIIKDMPGWEHGIICTRHISMTNSSVKRHAYFNFPAVDDNDIKGAFMDDDDTEVQDKDGRLFYLQTCKEMHLPPISMFIKQLNSDTVDLTYYGYKPIHVRAICLTLERNPFVKKLILGDCHLTYEACYFIGKLLCVSATLKELSLKDCRIGHKEMRAVSLHLPFNRVLSVLNLCGNRIRDEGVEILGNDIYANGSIRELNLSKNEISSRGAIALASLFEYNPNLTHLDLSWNQFFAQSATASMLSALSQSDALQELNLSWAGLSGSTVGQALRKVMRIPTLEKLDLSNNKFKGDDTISLFVKGMSLSQNFKVFNMSYNPLSPDDAVLLLRGMATRRTSIQQLLMDDVWIDERFLELREEVLKLPFRSGAIITCGGLLGTKQVYGEDPRKYTLFRAAFLGNKSKKHPVDIGLYFLNLAKTVTGFLLITDLMVMLKRDRVVLDEDLIERFAYLFPGPRTEKGALTINLAALSEYIRRIWPDKVEEFEKGDDSTLT